MPSSMRLVVFPSARGVRPQPGRRRAVAILAADAVGEIERAGALIGRNIERMTSQATRRRVGAGQSHDLRDPRSHRIGEVHEGVRMLVAHHPGAVFVLQHRGLIARLHAAVAAGRTARTGSGVSWRARPLSRARQHDCTARDGSDHYKTVFHVPCFCIESRLPRCGDQMLLRYNVTS